MTQQNKNIITETQTGTEVTLTPVLGYLDHPVVRASFTHPKVGHIVMDLAGWDTIKGQEAAFAHHNTYGLIALTIPQKDYNAALAAAKQIITTEISRIKNNEIKIELYWKEGEPLSGYMVKTKHAADLLKDLGIAKDVSGWGVMVERDAAESLGNTFEYRDAVEYTRPQRESAAKAAKDAEQARKARRQAKIAEAKETGNFVELDRWTEECSDKHEECSLDLVRQMIDGEGNLSIRRTHTH